jgi:riboflavin biosynthesis pyrimidine reductase
MSNSTDSSNDNDKDKKLSKLFPIPAESVSHQGNYLSHQLHKRGTQSNPFVYTNFVTSLDGRIALLDPEKQTYLVPKDIANSRDWRLFQELAAQADLLITSGRYIRQLAENKAQDNLPVSQKPDYADLLEWRKARNLSPQPAVAILSGSLDLPMPESLLNSGRQIYVITGSGSDSQRRKDLEAKGVSVIIAGRGLLVDGEQLITELGKRGFTTIEMVAGSSILYTLLEAGVLNRLYLTHSLKVLGGNIFDTIAKGEQLVPPVDLTLHSLYYDMLPSQEANQLFAAYDVVRDTQ